MSGTARLTTFGTASATCKQRMTDGSARRVHELGGRFGKPPLRSCTQASTRFESDWLVDSSVVFVKSRMLSKSVVLAIVLDRLTQEITTSRIRRELDTTQSLVGQWHPSLDPFAWSHGPDDGWSHEGGEFGFRWSHENGD